jgi:peptide/nickel transport system ATP-binding protein
VFQAVKFFTFTIMNKPLLSIQNLEISLKKEGIYSSVIKNISYDLQQ